MAEAHEGVEDDGGDAIIQNPDDSLDMEQYPWLDLFEGYTSPFYGFVKSMDDVCYIINEFSITTSTAYTTTTSTKEFGTFNT